MKIGIITQARTSSSRFPKKILSHVKGQTILELHLDRLKNSKIANEFIVATIPEKDTKTIKNIANKSGFDIYIYEGEENNVLDRYLKAINKYNLDIVVRVTSDCPLIDPYLVDDIINQFLNSNVDYLSNTLSDSYPDGQDVEVFYSKALMKCAEFELKNSEKEHVTLGIKNNPLFKKKEFNGNEALRHEYSGIRMTVDYKKDLEVIKFLVNKLGTRASWKVFWKQRIQEHGLERLFKLLFREY